MVTQKFLQAFKQGDVEARRQLICRLFLPPDPEIVPTLVDCLSDSSSAVCEAAVEALGTCCAPACVELIVSRVYSPNPVERNYVLEIIGIIGSPALVPVTQLLNNPERNVRKQAIDALIMIGSDEICAPLKKALTDPDPIVASSAAEALGQMRFVQAIPNLEEALKKSDEWIKVAVLTSLANIGGDKALQILCNLPINQPDTVIATVIQAVEVASAADKPLAVNFLVRLLAHEQIKFESNILSVLESLLSKGDHLKPEQRQIIINSAQKFIDSPNLSTCATAIKCLASLSEFQPGRLSQFAQSVHFPLRLAALQAMLQTGDIDTSLAVSIAFNSNEKKELRVLALRLLAKNVEWNSIIEAQLLVTAHQDDIQLRIGAINALFQKKSEKAIQAALDLFDDEESWDEDTFISNFEVSASDLLVKLLKNGFKKLGNAGRYHMFHALLPLDQKPEFILDDLKEYDILLNALQDPYWAIRVHAARLYGERYTKNGNLLVVMASHDPDVRVRTTAVNILIDEKKLSPELLLFLLHDQSVRVRRVAMISLLEMEREKISSLIQEEVLRISSSSSENKDKEFAELYREIIRKFSNERI